MHAPLSLLVSLDICRLLAPPRAGAGTLLSLSSLLRGRPAEIRRPPYLPSCSSLLSLSLSSLSHVPFLYLVAVAVRSSARTLGAGSARYAERCRRDYLRRGLSKPRGGTRCTVNQAFAYRIFDLRPGDALAATAPRRAAPRRAGQSA